MTEEQLHIVQEINTSDLCSIISSRNSSLEDEIRRLKNENKLLGERCNQLLTDKGKLIDENAELKEYCNALDKSLITSTKNNIERQKIIDRLNEENTELKSEKGCETCIKFDEVKLTKAKELLNEFMRISKASDEDFEHDYSELIGETEQFIKDLEK